MKKLLVILAMTMASSSAFAERVNVCTMEIANNPFAKTLNIAISDKDYGTDNGMVWVDTPVPYGMRLYGYIISDVQCRGEGQISIFATQLGNTHSVLLETNGNLGQITYITAKGEKGRSIPVQCDSAALAQVKQCQ